MAENLPPEPASEIAALLRIVADIEAQDDDQREDLLAAFLSAAWGTRCAFEQ